MVTKCLNIKVVKFYVLLFILNSVSLLSFSQDKEPISIETNFKDGIYFTFNDFKNNKPNISDFEIVSENSGKIYLQFNCIAKDGSQDICSTDNAWAYCKDNSLYIYQDFPGRFYRVTIIGALIHYVKYSEAYYYDDFNYRYSSIPHRTIQANEMIVDWKTGRNFMLSYQQLSNFIKEKDVELYSQWMSTRKKKKMIYFFLLKYNERNKVYFN